MITIVDPAPRGLRWLASLAIFAATVLSLVNLPGDELPVEWLLAFTVPGAILGAWSRLQRTPWRRALFAVVMQATACYVALQLVGPMTRPAALACTILPPLAFAATRNHDADPSLALFLSFCVLLVGIILDGLVVPILLAYGVVAFLSLHASTLLASHRTTSMRHHPTSRLRAIDASATSLMTVCCLLAVFAIDRSLQCLPSPSSSSTDNAAMTGGGSGPRSIGLDDSFVLDGEAGAALSNLKGERLVQVARTDGQPIGERLYLRCGFFARPGLERWEIGERRIGPSSHPEGHVIRKPWAGVPLLQLDIERYAGAAKFVFLPPDSISLEGLRGLHVDPVREWIRPSSPNEDFYSVRFQELSPPEPYAKFDRRASELGLLQLPQNLDRDALLRLMDQWSVGDEPLEAMAAIADGLAGHCTYARREPVGPFAHALENFLFAERDRHGYCMHFASAAALMLRLKGIPCRVGVGLYGGSADRNNRLARVFGSQNAHAWVELFFEGRGYVIFDPTPSGSRGRGFVPDDKSTPEGMAGDDPQSSLLDPTVQAVTDFLSKSWVWAIALAVALLLAITPRRQPRRPQPPEPVFARHARRSLAKLLRALAAAGHVRKRGQTLELFAGELAQLDRLQPDVRAAFATYQEVRFGGRAFDDERHRRMEQGIQAANELRENQRADADNATGQ